MLDFLHSYLVYSLDVLTSAFFMFAVVWMITSHVVAFIAWRKDKMPLNIVRIILWRYIKLGVLAIFMSIACVIVFFMSNPYAVPPLNAHIEAINTFVIAFLFYTWAGRGSTKRTSQDD